MTARPTRTLSVGLLTCALVLTGCSKGPATSSTDQTSPSGAGQASTSTSTSTSPSPATSSTGSASGSASGTAAATGDEVKGKSRTFTVVPPEGWTEATAKASGVANIDLVLLSSKKVGSFANNLVVLSSAGDQSVLDEEMSKGREQMSAAGRTITTAPTRAVAGAPAVGFTTTFQRDGIKVLARSYGVQRDGKIYLLTLSSSQGEADHALAEFDELLSTWAWT
ncbi:hypothetical protein [Terrabacter sp. 2RAF25]|uniref:hypothetical protein n=1 Tax=Terrabacter sp. 2RAF25 TaxID=3232998 RepID=UPI003F965D06